MSTAPAWLSPILLAVLVVAGCAARHDRTIDAGVGDLDAGASRADAAPRDADGDARATAVDAGPGHLDTDGDTIFDADEGAGDPDLDGVPSYRDSDSDGDGVSDREEAGDLDLTTPPVECAAEIDWSSGLPRSDGTPDFLDADSDDDGLDDGVERRDGLDPCSVDSDGDGQEDLVEHEHSCVDCPGRPLSRAACDCAVSAACGVPSTEVVVELPYAGAAQERDVYFTVPTTAPAMPIDVSVTTRDDTCDPDGVDASRFVQRLVPATFIGAAEGTSLRVHVTLQNDLAMASDRRRVFVALLDATAGTASAFEHREVYVVVAAATR